MASETDIPGSWVFGFWARFSVVNHNLSRPESLTVLNAWYSSVCLHAPHTQCFMQCSVYNDASLVLGCVCVLTLWEALSAFFQSEVILGFLFSLQGASFGLRLAAGMKK